MIEREDKPFSLTEKEEYQCGDCQLFRTSNCSYAQVSNAVLETDVACADFISNSSDLPFLHQAGGINEFFVYEPLGDGEYIYHSKDEEKGIAKIEVEYDDEQKKSKPRHYLLINNKQFYFKEKPETNFLFKIPRKNITRKWIKGTKTSLSIKKLWELTQIYLRTFLDLPKKCEYSIYILFIIQSWIVELLRVVFYVGIQGEWGGGKTVSAEALYILCRHGYQTGNLSPAFVARSIEKEKLSIFVDELDSVAGSKDSDLYQIFRQGYRRGGTYSRINKDTMKRETHGIFGSKIFTVHSSIETALQTRTIPLHVRETNDPRYPVIGSDKSGYGIRLFEEYFLWYLDNAFLLKENSLEALQLDYLDGLDLFTETEMGENPSIDVMDRSEELRQKLFERKISLLRKGQVSQLSGRNVELAYQMFVLSNLLDVDIDQDIVEVFTQKTIEEGEQREIGFMGVLKDALTTIYREKMGDGLYLTDDGNIKVSNKECYRRFNGTLKKEGNSGVSPHKFKEYLSEFGFSDVLNRKKLEVPLPGDEESKSRLCNIFTPRVLRKLELDVEQETVTPAYTHITQTTLEEPLLGDLIPQFRKKFPRGEFHLEDFWIDWLKDKGCSQERAEAYFKKLKETILFYGQEGWAVG